jgi:hypothetical protein
MKLSSFLFCLLLSFEAQAQCEIRTIIVDGKTLTCTICPNITFCD